MRGGGAGRDPGRGRGDWFEAGRDVDEIEGGHPALDALETGFDEVLQLRSLEAVTERKVGKARIALLRLPPDQGKSVPVSLGEP